MRYQWITRLLGNPLVVSDEIMEPFAREVLEQASALGNAVVLILDQFSDRHQVLMLALRFGERAVPLAWRIEATEGASKPRRRSWRRWPRGCPRARGSGSWATASTAPPT
jgi:hypothetical protein